MKKNILFSIVGLSLLPLMPAAFAADCNLATVNAVGSGVVSDTDVGTDYSLRWVDVTCLDNEVGSQGRYYFHKTTDPDGKIKLASTALSEGKLVSYTLYSGTPSNTYIVQFSVNAENKKDEKGH